MSGYPDKKYHGFDWTELCSTFNVPEGHPFEEIWDGHIKDPYNPAYEDSFYLEVYLKSLRSASHFKDGTPRTVRFAAKHIRAFLAELIIEARLWNYDYPLWEGMIKLEDDVTLIQYFAEVCKNAWT